MIEREVYNMNKPKGHKTPPLSISLRKELEHWARKRSVVRAAQQLQADRISQYNQGLLTPHDLAEAVVEIWLEATEMTR